MEIFLFIHRAMFHALLIILVITKMFSFLTSNFQRRRLLFFVSFYHTHFIKLKGSHYMKSSNTVIPRIGSFNVVINAKRSSRRYGHTNTELNIRMLDLVIREMIWSSE